MRRIKSSPGPGVSAYRTHVCQKNLAVRKPTAIHAAKQKGALKLGVNRTGAFWREPPALVPVSALGRNHGALAPGSFTPDRLPWHLITAARAAATAVMVAVPVALLAFRASLHLHQRHHELPRRAALVAPARTPAAGLAVVAAHHAPLASLSVSQFFQTQSEAIVDALAYVNYKILQAMTLPTWGKMLTVLAVALPILAAGSWALCAWTGLRPGAALLRCYLILNNVPGADIASEADPRAAVVLNLVYTIGLLTFAALIGVLGDDISSAVEAARLGNSRVPERNHTVVLGHNRQLVEVLRQVALVRADRGASAFPGQLVVLSDLDRGTLERILVDELGPAAAAGVVTRQGSPLKVADLQRVSAGHARTVIMLAPEQGEDDGVGGDGDAADAASGGGDAEDASSGLALSLEARQSVTLAALHHLRQQALRGPGGGRLGTEPQTVVVQHDADLDLLDPDVFTLPGARAGAGQGGTACSGWTTGPGASKPARHLVTPVSHLNSLSRIQAQCASQPGLSVVMTSIMKQQPGMPEFYVQRVPDVDTLTYGEARRLFPRAVLCGVYDPGAATAFTANSAEARLDAAAKAVVLNPPDSMPLLEHYSLVLLADRTDDLRLSRVRLRQLGHTRHLKTTQSWAVPRELRLKAQQEDDPQGAGGRHHPFFHLHLHHHLHFLHPLHLRHHLHLHHHPHLAQLPQGEGRDGAALDQLQPQTLVQLPQMQQELLQPHHAQKLQQGQQLDAQQRQQEKHTALRGFWTFGRRSETASASASTTQKDPRNGGFAPNAVQEQGTRAERGAAPVRVVVLAFNGQQPEELLEGLSDYCPPGSEAVVVASRDSAAIRGQPGSLQQQRRLRIRTVVGDPRTRASLLEAKASVADAVILTGLEGGSTDRADAQSLATLIQLQALMPPLHPGVTATDAAGGAVTFESADSSLTSDSTTDTDADLRSSSQSEPPARPPLNMVCSVTDPRVKEIMFSLVHVQSGAGASRRPVTIETINSDELLAGVLTQVAAEPRLSGLFHELSMAEGVEVHLRSPTALELPYNEPLTWEQVQDAGRERGVTVIGLLRAGGAEVTQPRLLLGVPLRPWGAAMEFRQGDRVVVLSGE